VLETRHDDVKETLDTLLAEVRAMRNELTKYKGFVGGVAWFGFSLAVLIGLVFTWLQTRAHG
jgi:hypothetical protein